jgi:hypothetical protein
VTESEGGVPREAEVLLYQTEDGTARIEVRFEGETAWMTRISLAELYQTTPQNITQLIAAIYAEGELAEEATGGRAPGPPPAEALQPARGSRRWLPRSFEPRHAVPPVGNESLGRVRRQRFHDGRRPPEEPAGAGRAGLLRRVARAHPRHSVVGEGLLAQGPGDLCHQRFTGRKRKAPAHPPRLSADRESPIQRRQLSSASLSWPLLHRYGCPDLP